MSIIIDSVTYDIPLISIRGKAQALDRSAERTTDGTLHRNVIGTYYNYELVFGRSTNDTADYDALWDVITAPNESWEITLPDPSGNLTFDCYFGDREHDIHYINGAYYYKSLSFSVIGISPARTP